MVSFNLFAQSYSELWKQVDVARGKDLPKTQLTVLKKIVGKAQREKSYGNLLAAELLTSSLQTQISPDSVDTEKARLKELCDKTEETDKILYVCQQGWISHCFIEISGARIIFCIVTIEEFA